MVIKDNGKEEESLQCQEVRHILKSRTSRPLESSVGKRKKKLTKLTHTF